MGYMCGVDYQHEVGEVMDSTPVYSSVEDLKRQRTCWKRCGICEIEIRAVKWVEPQDFSNGKSQKKKE
jgi:ribosomal protein L34E